MYSFLLNTCILTAENTDLSWFLKELVTVYCLKVDKSLSFHTKFQVSSISQVLDKEESNSVTTLPHPPSQK